jgi:hypothetical protein
MGAHRGDGVLLRRRHRRSGHVRRRTRRERGAGLLARLPVPDRVTERDGFGGTGHADEAGEAGEAAPPHPEASSARALVVGGSPEPGVVDDVDGRRIRAGGARPRSGAGQNSGGSQARRSEARRDTQHGTGTGAEAVTDVGLRRKRITADGAVRRSPREARAAGAPVRRLSASPT